jgi:hypothetical protein
VETVVGSWGAREAGEAGEGASGGRGVAVDVVVCGIIRFCECVEEVRDDRAAGSRLFIDGSRWANSMRKDLHPKDREQMRHLYRRRPLDTSRLIVVGDSLP